MSRLIGITFITSLLCLAAPVAVLGEDDCTADVRATLEHEEQTRLQFSVEVSTSASCAKIEYDLIIEEQTSDGQAKRVRKIRYVKLNDGSLTELVEHKLPPGHRMLSYEAKVEKCMPCDLTP